MNSLGHSIKLTSFGESHGPMVGAVLDGLPSGITLNFEEIQKELDRRKPGNSELSSERKEDDKFEIVSGVFENKTTGAPITILIPNKNQNSDDYLKIKDHYRPGHADFTYQQKYGIRDYRGGGRSSARVTAAWVAAGAICKQFLKQKTKIEIQAIVSQVYDCILKKPLSQYDWSMASSNVINCPDKETAAKMENIIKEVKLEGDTVGGVISCRVLNCPVGLGEPVFDKLHADLGKAMLSINAVKGFEYGSGFAGTKMLGSEHNDVFKAGDKITTATNHSGGIQGGISNGEDIYFNVAFKPVATIMQNQETVNAKGEAAEIHGKGRHDPCVLPRAVPIVEAMTALVLVDHLLRSRSNKLRN